MERSVVIGTRGVGRLYFMDFARGIVMMLMAWYCDEDDIILMLHVIHVHDLSQPDVISQDLEQKWLMYGFAQLSLTLRFDQRYE